MSRSVTSGYRDEAGASTGRTSKGRELDVRFREPNADDAFEVGERDPLELGVDRRGGSVEGVREQGFV